MADQGTPFLDDRGNVTFVTPEDLPYAKEQGWKSLTQDDLAEIATEKALKADNAGPLGSIKSGLEAGGEALTLGLSDYAERAAGVDPRAIKVREEMHPLAHGLGTFLGIAAPLVLTGGASALEEAPGLAGTAAKYTAPALISRAGEAAEGLASKALSKPLLAADVVASNEAELGAAKEAYEASKAIPGADPLREVDVGGLQPGGLGKSLAFRGLKGLAGGATEGALYGAGELVHEKALDEPISTGAALGTIGLSALLGGGVGGAGGLVAEVGSRVAPGLMRVLSEIEDKGKLKQVQEEAAQIRKEAMAADPTKATLKDLGMSDDLVDSYRSIVDDARTRGWVGPTSTADSVAAKAFNGVRDDFESLNSLAEQNSRDKHGFRLSELEGARFLNGLRKIAGEDEITQARFDQAVQKAGVPYEMDAADLVRLWDSIQKSDTIYDPHFRDPTPFLDLLRPNDPKLARAFSDYADTSRLAEQVQRIWSAAPKAAPEVAEAAKPKSGFGPEVLGGLAGFAGEHVLAQAAHTLTGALGLGAVGALAAHAIKKVMIEHGPELAGKLAGALKSKVENWPSSLVEEMLLGRKARGDAAHSTVIMGDAGPIARMGRNLRPKVAGPLSEALAGEAGKTKPEDAPAPVRPWDKPEDPLHTAIVHGEPTAQSVTSTVVLKHYEQGLRDRVDETAASILEGPSSVKAKLDEKGTSDILSEVKKLTANPEALIEKMTEATSDLATYFPTVSEKTSSTIVRGITYLASVAPKGTPPSILEPEGGKPSKTDLYQFQMRAAATMDPLQAIEDYGPHPAVMNTIQQVSPEIMDMIRQSVIGQIKPGEQSYQQLMATQAAIGMQLVPGSLVPLPPSPIGDAIPTGLKNPRIKGLGGGRIKGLTEMAKATRATVSPYRRPFGQRD